MKKVFVFLTGLLTVLVVVHGVTWAMDMIRPMRSECFEYTNITKEQGNRGFLFNIEKGYKCAYYHAERGVSAIGFWVSIPLFLISLLAFHRDRRRIFLLLSIAYLLFATHCLLWFYCPWATPFMASLRKPLYIIVVALLAFIIFRKRIPDTWKKKIQRLNSK